MYRVYSGGQNIKNAEQIFFLMIITFFIAHMFQFCEVFLEGILLFYYCVNFQASLLHDKKSYNKKLFKSIDFSDDKILRTSFIFELLLSFSWFCFAEFLLSC